jgi:hypothetical protein
MAMARIRIGLAVVALLAASASAEIYRWRDAAGVEHFNTDLDAVPPQHRAAARAAASEGQGGGGSYSAGGGEGEAASATPTPAPVPAPEAELAPTSRVPGFGAPASAAKDAAETIGGGDEEWWRARSRDFLDRIADLERRAEACEDMEPLSRRAQQGHHAHEIAALNDCAIAQSQLDATRMSHEKFEESARRQGVPPGWLR